MSIKRIAAALALTTALSTLAAGALAQQAPPSCELPPGPGPSTPAVTAVTAVSGRTVLDQANLTLSASGPSAPIAIELEAGRSYVIETYGLGPRTDTVLHISHNNGVIAENDDVQPGTLSSRVRITAAEAGTYHARVTPYDPTTGGTYGVRVIEVAASAGPLTGPKI